MSLLSTILLFLIGAANGTSGKNKNIFFPEMIISGLLNVQVLLATKVPPHKTFFYECIMRVTGFERAYSGLLVK